MNGVVCVLTTANSAFVISWANQFKILKNHLILLRKGILSIYSTMLAWPAAGMSWLVDCINWSAGMETSPHMFVWTLTIVIWQRDIFWTRDPSTIAIWNYSQTLSSTKTVLSSYAHSLQTHSSSINKTHLSTLHSTIGVHLDKWWKILSVNVRKWKCTGSIDVFFFIYIFKCFM